MQENEKICLEAEGFIVDIHNHCIFKFTRSREVKKICICLALLCLAAIAYGATDDELFDRGVVLLKQEKSKEAVQVFTQLIEQVPDSPDAYRNRGVGYMKLNQYDEALRDFEKAMTLKPDLKNLYSNMGVAWYYKNKPH